MKSLLFVTTFLILLSCKSNEIGSGRDVDPESIYYDYHITGEETNPEVTLNLQFRFGGESGTTLVMYPPATVALDGKPLLVDSSRLAGAYYLLRVPAEGFTGLHTIRFTDKAGKTHEEEFSYQPFQLSAAPPLTVQRQPLTLELTNYNTNATSLRVVLTDTAFASEDFNEAVPVTNGRFTLDSTQWKTLVNGPITMELYREEDRPLRNPSKEGGRLQQMYSLRREFILTK